MTVTRQAGLICSRIDAGYRLAEVAAQFGITRQRVHQVYVKATGHGVPTRAPIVRDGSSIRLRKFWTRFGVAKSGCWEWTGPADPNGYGRAWADYSHRVAFALVKGSIPPGLTIDHLCRNRLCGNPGHLEAVSARENILRSPIAPAAVNARKTHCLRGHPFDEANTYRGGGGRSCRACRKAQKHADRERIAAA